MFFVVVFVVVLAILRAKFYYILFITDKSFFYKPGHAFVLQNVVSWSVPGQSLPCGPVPLYKHSRCLIVVPVSHEAEQALQAFHCPHSPFTFCNKKGDGVLCVASCQHIHAKRLISHFSKSAFEESYIPQFFGREVQTFRFVARSCKTS